MLFVMQAEYQRAGVRFLQHDVRTEYDEPSDVARLYRIRATPSFAFFSDGSKVSVPPCAPKVQARLKRQILLYVSVQYSGFTTAVRQGKARCTSQQMQDAQIPSDVSWLLEGVSY